MYFYELPVGAVFEDYRGDLGFKGPELEDDYYIRDSTGELFDTEYDPTYEIARVLNFIEATSWVNDRSSSNTWSGLCTERAMDKVLSWFDAQPVKSTGLDTSVHRLCEGILKAIAALDRYPEQRVLKSELLRLLLDADDA